MSTDAAPARKRGRPRATAAEIQARRDKLVHAAYEVFLDKGYHATSISDITSRAGLGFGTYYKGFDNKREILDPVIDYGVEQILGDILGGDLSPAPAPTSVDDFENQLRGIGHRIREAFAARPRLAKFLVMEANTIDEAASERWYGLVDLGATLVAAYLEQGITAGVLREEFDTSETGQAVMGTILMGVVRAARHDSSAGIPAAYIDAVIALVRAGVSRDECTPNGSTT
ncbi:TetR/AcrR family transcriptional regulator [Nocardia sp. NPDC050406]|uniref:TetR/AcrR family transcriptional regulator n=1 Tax=Nocardia sp. NPDC050406 TaxID=3364318 RepID=UPI0037B39993